MQDETQSDGQVEVGTDPAPINNDPSQSESPVEAAIRKEQGGSKYTEEEKAVFNLKKNLERVKELGLDPEAILNVAPKAGIDKDAPLTVGMLEQVQKENAKKTAIQKAAELTDAHERELTILYLENRIVPSGDADEDLRMARALVNSVKNSQVATLAVQSKPVSSAPSSAGAPGKLDTPVELTKEEKQLMEHFKLTPEEVIAARQ